MKIITVALISSIALAMPASAQYYGYPVQQPHSPLIRINPYTAVIPGLPTFYGYTLPPPPQPAVIPSLPVKPVTPPPPPPQPLPHTTLPPPPTPKPIVKPPFVDNEDAQDRLERKLGKRDSDDFVTKLTPPPVMPFKGYHH